MKFLQPFMIVSMLVAFGNCAELFSSKDKDNNEELILAALLAGPGCGPTAVSGSAGNGTKYNFAGCSGDANTILSGFGFTVNGVTFNSGIQGTSSASTIVTNASSLSETGNESKAGIEVVYVMNQAGSSIDAMIQTTPSLAGPGVRLSPTSAQWLDASTASAFGTKAGSPWASSVSVEKSVCLEVHKESGKAHIFGWSVPCNSVADRGNYEFDQEDATITNFSGDRVGVRINNAIIKSITIYSTAIGTNGSFR
ncbi:hypothetical protein [Leptospira jelokensis]|uniref:Lipoprotein n=1 Tax=Leptospira jelokensis TaxID=2484931 RepID=A0A4Z1A8S6_9LEPT|nr:hypothetical protein [Leptospira jelokensis]TGL72248.1 hypothetical protein EHQ62_05310 [Leptospira jelokensis]